MQTAQGCTDQLPFSKAAEYPLITLAQDAATEEFPQLGHALKLNFLCKSARDPEAEPLL